LIVLNLPDAMAGREMELVQHCRAQNFGIWPTLSEPVQVRIGILNLLNQAAINDIVSRFGQAMRELGAEFDQAQVDAAMDQHYTQAVAAE
jgi:aspartate aminotransferase-like enzyme